MARYSKTKNQFVGGSALGDIAGKVSGQVITAAGNTAAFNTDDARSVVATLNVTAVSGTTPSLTVNVQTSGDGGTTWTTVGSFAAKTAVSSERKVFTGLDELTRFQWGAPSGTTPSFTVSIDGYTK